MAAEEREMNCLEGPIDAQNVVLLSHAQSSSKHKNCRIGGLMFDNQHTWNSTPNSLLPGI